MSISRLRFLAAIIAIFTVLSAALEIPSRGGASGVSIIVAVFPNSSKTAKTPVSPDSDLAAAINKLRGPLYSGYVVGDKNCKGDCSAANATIFVQIAQDGKGGFDFTAFGSAKGSYIGELQGKMPDAKSGSIAFTNDDLRVLLGTAIIQDNTVEISYGYHQYIELVPDLQSPTDPDYSFALMQELRRRGITAIRSQYNTVSLASAPDDAICASGDRYLIYSVAIDTYNQTPFKLYGATKLRAQTNGFLLDCVSRTSRGFAGEKNVLVPTTNAMLTGIGAILLSFYSKFGTRFTLSSAAISNFVDVDPTSVNQRNPVAEASIRKFVDQFCNAIPLMAPTPMPTVAAMPEPSAPPQVPSPKPSATSAAKHGPSPHSPPPIRPQVPPAPAAGNGGSTTGVSAGTGVASTTTGGADVTSGSAVAGSGASVPFNPDAFTAPFSYPLACHEESTTTNRDATTAEGARERLQHRFDSTSTSTQ